MYRPLGEGDVDIAAIVATLERPGYAGWYVLEQDTMLTGPPDRCRREPRADVRASVAHLRPGRVLMPPYPGLPGGRL